MALLKLKGVYCRKGRVTVIRGADLELDEGEIRALVGLRGAGKSTLLMAISGLGVFSRGELFFRGDSIRGLSPARIVRAGLSQVPAGRRLFAALTVAENLELGAWGRRDAAGVARDREMVMDLFPSLAAVVDLPAGRLAGGEQQALAIGRALMAAPRLLMLDEPSRGLEPLAAEMIFAGLERLAGEGLAVLLAEENARAALTLADYGYLLAAGRVAAAGPAGELLRDERLRRLSCGD